MALKRIYMCLGLILLCICASSCSEKEKTAYEVLKEKFSEKYPDGYDMGYQWYSFKDQTVEETYKGEKSIRTIDFVGYIDFEQDRTEGITTKFIYTYDVVTIKDGELVGHYTMNQYLNDSNFYVLSEKTDSTKAKTSSSEGCSNADYFKIRLKLNDNLFHVDCYEAITPTYYDISVTANHVVLDQSDSDEYGFYSEKTGYYYDEDYIIRKMFYYYDKTFNVPLHETIRNTSITRFLSLAEEVEINVPKEYDQEYVYDKEYTIIGLGW